MRSLPGWTSLAVGGSASGLAIFGAGAAVTAVISPAVAAPLMIAAFGGLAVFGAAAGLAAVIPDDVHDVLGPDPMTTAQPTDSSGNVHYLNPRGNDQVPQRLSA